jgi:hypothetical protein
MESFFAAAGEPSFLGLIVVFSIAVVASIAGWSRRIVTRWLAIVLAISVAQGVRAQWDISAIYSYVAAGLVCALLWAIADYAHKRQVPSADA